MLCNVANVSSSYVLTLLLMVTLASDANCVVSGNKQGQLTVTDQRYVSGVNLFTEYLS